MQHNEGAVSIYGFNFTIIDIPITKVKQSHDDSVFIMGIPYMERWY